MPDSFALKAARLFSIAVVLTGFATAGCIRNPDLTIFVYNDTSARVTGAAEFRFEPSGGAPVAERRDFALDTDESFDAAWGSLGRAQAGRLHVHVTLADGRAGSNAWPDWRGGEGPNTAMVWIGPDAIDVRFAAAD